MSAKPIVFDDFFELGQSEQFSPFLIESSRKWGQNLYLKCSLFALLFLILSFVFSFYPSLVPISHIFLLGVYFLVGIPALIESLKELSLFNINIDILMTLAAFSSVLIGSGMEGGLLLVLFALSGSMEDAVTAKAKGAISSLHKLSPTKATVIENDGSHLERAVQDITVGTHILVKAAQVVPLDGIVVSGTSSVNLVHLTGENFPIMKIPGDEVAAGARNLEGALVLKVTKTSSDSTLAKIIELVTEAQAAKPKLQRLFNHFSNKYAITIISLAALFAILFPFLLNIPFLGVEGSLYRALSFLIAASPCALIIAIPIAYLSAVSTCAKKGILIKGGVTLDALCRCKIIALDKTGTLTTGDLEVLFIEAEDEKKLGSAISLAYALEKNALHPIAKAIITYANKNNLQAPEIEKFYQTPGSGLSAHYLGTEIHIGRPEFIASKLIEAQVFLKTIERFKESGDLITVLLIDQTTYLFSFQDSLRKGMKEAIDALKQDLKVIMLTGDHALSANRIAKKLGIDEVYADLKPENKLELISELSKKQDLAMVGDGVNDAPALARATVGICMGKVGQTAAIDAADVVLLHDNIEYLDWLFKKAHQTKRIVTQNLTLAISAIILASLPALGGYIPLWLAVVMHEGGTVLVGLNALRLLRR